MGNRVTASEPPSAHNITIGASFGAAREPRFKHLETGLEFGFPQSNGDVFVFTEPVNSAFQHCIPKRAPAASAGPRISVILWGRIERQGILQSSNALGEHSGATQVTCPPQSSGQRPGKELGCTDAGNATKPSHRVH